MKRFIRQIRCYTTQSTLSNNPSSASHNNTLHNNTSSVANSNNINVQKEKKNFFIPAKFQTLLEKEGLTAKQASVILSLIQETVKESQINIFSRIVSKSEHSTILEDQKMELENLKKTIKNAETRNFNMAKDDLERVRESLKRVATDAPSNIAKVSANAKLDLNLEKSRVKEELVSMEKRVHTNDERISAQTNSLRTRIKTVEKEMTESIRSAIAGAVFMFLAWKVLNLSAERMLAKEVSETRQELDIVAANEALEWVSHAKENEVQK